MTTHYLFTFVEFEVSVQKILKQLARLYEKTRFKVLKRSFHIERKIINEIKLFTII